MLYNFNRLRIFLDKIAPSPAFTEKRNLIIEGEDFTRKASEGSVEYRNNGIFIIIEGQEFQRYIYKKHYLVARYGLPKFHFIKCRTIHEYGISNYSSASKDRVTIIDRNTNQIHKNVILQICKNCLKEAHGNVPKNTVAFFKKIDQKTEHESREQDVDIFGYTFDWQEIRENYLKRQANKCEHCKIQMEGFDTRYIHIHHKNGNKKWNHSSNLECLCVLCHSMVDERHIENFSKNRMQVEIDDFIKKYQFEIKRLNSFYLNSYNRKKRN